jgi:transglutaminase-like putative cysteine protease/predicted glutamine amidotransferase
LSELLAASFDGPSSPAVTLKPTPGGRDPSWGLSWYPGDERGAMLLSDPTALSERGRPSVVGDWDRFRSSLFVCHLRGARPRLASRDPQPFIRSYAGRDWVFAHQGDLAGDWRRELALPAHPTFEPTGATDSEHAFCWLLETARALGARTLASFGWELLRECFDRIAALGQANLLLSDGQTLVAHHGGDASGALHWSRRTPPHEQARFDGRDLALELPSPLDFSRTQVFVSTQPLLGVRWQPFEVGQLLALRRGHVVWNSHPATLEEAIYSRREIAAQRALVSSPAAPAPEAPSSRLLPTPPLAGPSAQAPQRVLEVVHETVYRYAAPVERSTHHFRMEPLHDLRQRPLAHALEISVAGRRRDYEDVFGNRVVMLDVQGPFTELRVVGRSRVAVDETSPQELISPQRRDPIPLVWMPWQRQMMNPYLLPRELPETQLRELSEYAMSFAERNDSDLLATLLDINRTIYRDYRYVPGSTTVGTTAFEVYTARRGVCQDFASLFITLARLMGVPARYRVGYVYTGGSYENKIQSEASHAWVEIYLPWTGWRGFDPTNGCLAGSDHIRVACGRLYWDAAPTSGTIYQGGGSEQLSVRVEVREADPSARA